MRRVLLAPSLVFALTRCGSFGSASSDVDAALDGGADATSPELDDAAATDADSTAVDATPVDGGAGKVRCGTQECDLGKGEACCLYRMTGTLVRRATCAPQGQCPAPLQGETKEVEASCDDGTDCPAGQICCHLRDNCGAIALVSAQCVAPSNCIGCADGGQGRVACDPFLVSSCPAGACVSQDIVLVSRGYCD